jgi:CheY-like chemotaxis protein/two-component sensor histidine kinase
MLSHELRNPLAPIANAVHVLQASDKDPLKLKWAQEVLSRQVKQMNRLVDDLLDVSRITQGKIELKMDSVDVAEVVAVAVETARPFIDAQEHELTVRMPAHPVRVKGDFSRLAQILSNLFNNAAKYTDKKGRIELEVAEDGAEIVFRVRDSGIGIPAEAQATIFDLFKQLGNTVDRSQGGLGIGLTLVKRLVELHGGTIKAKSEGPGLGSEFVVRLPLLSGAPADRGAESQPATDKAAGLRKRHRILVADDNVDLAESMGLLLEMMGNDVRVTNDGMAAVAAESEFRPNIVFLDIGMAKLNGYDACRRIRGNQWGSTPIIVALTGWGQAEDKRRSREAGFDHHLVKPIEPAALEQFLAELESQVA